MQALALLVCSAFAWGVVGSRQATHRDVPDAAAQIRGDPFYITRCAACDKERYRTGKSIAAVYDSREFRFCAEECRTSFEADRQAHIAALDQRLIADQVPMYPLNTSIVSSRALPDKPMDVIWNNRLFRLADESERAALMSEPEKHLHALDDAVIAAQSPVYGPTKCPVQGDFFVTDTIVEIVIGNRMIRLCCSECVRVVRANPGQYMKMVDSANREAARKRPAAETRPG
jgi:hypothetical protein